MYDTNPFLFESNELYCSMNEPEDYSSSVRVPLVDVDELLPFSKPVQLQCDNQLYFITLIAV